MNRKYAYSLDHELWIGRFSSRVEALTEALRKATTDQTAPQTVYVGQITAVDPSATGHAKSILNSISRRMRAELGESADNLLASVTDEQIKQLDEALASVIIAWLNDIDVTHALNRIAAISEHPVPTMPHVPDSSTSEVQEIGASEFPGDAP